MTQLAKSKQPTVRVNASAKEKIDRMQVETRLSQPALLDRAISLLERKLLSEQIEADFTALAEDEAMLAAYKGAIAKFDNASGDRLLP